MGEVLWVLIGLVLLGLVLCAEYENWKEKNVKDASNKFEKRKRDWWGGDSKLGEMWSVYSDEADSGESDSGSGDDGGGGE